MVLICEDLFSKVLNVTVTLSLFKPYHSHPNVLQLFAYSWDKEQLLISWELLTVGACHKIDQIIRDTEHMQLKWRMHIHSPKKGRPSIFKLKTTSSGTEPWRCMSLIAQMAALFRLTSNPGNSDGISLIPIRFLTTSSCPFCKVVMLFCNGIKSLSSVFCQ